MIHHLDNSESAGPKSVTAREDWRRRKRPATINENHARELLELHTISPKPVTHKMMLLNFLN